MYRYDVGLLREDDAEERRVLLSPASIRAIIDAGFTVAVQIDAGIGVGYADADYAAAGAVIARRSEILTWGRILLKWRAPSLRDASCLQPDQVIAANFHAENNRRLTMSLLRRRVTAYAFEFFEDDTGEFVLGRATGDIAGRLGALYAA